MKNLCLNILYFRLINLELVPRRSTDIVFSPIRLPAESSYQIEIEINYTNKISIRIGTVLLNKITIISDSNHFQSNHFMSNYFQYACMSTESILNKKKLQK